MGEATTLGRLVERGILLLGDGYRTKRSEHGSPGFRILRVADVENNRIRAGGGDFVREEFARFIGSKLSEPGDVLLTTKGTVGRVAIVGPEMEQVVYSPQLCYLRVHDESVVDRRFLAFWLKSEAFTKQAAHHANNTDMAPYISLGDLRSVRVDLPKVERQRAIAEVLGALDDKIAANERSIRCAGELADAQFARFRQVAKTIQRTFAEVAEVGGGGTPRTSVAEYWGESIPWATPTDVTGLAAPYLHQTSRSITDEGLAACSSSLYPIGSILMTSRATIGAFAIAQVPVAVNQGFIVVNAKDPELQWWIYHDMRSRVDEFLAHSNGATFLELPRGKFKQLPVQAPGLDAALRFSEVVGPLHGVATARLVENARLAATRDELLPLLMSGRLHVKDAEKLVAEVV